MDLPFPDLLEAFDCHLLGHEEGMPNRVMAIDLSVAMLDQARLNIEVNSLINRIALAHIDSKELLYEDDQFDVVMSNSIVHHIPEPGTVIAEAVRVTKSGGRLFFRDLLRPIDDSTVQHLVATYAAEAIKMCI